MNAAVLQAAVDALRDCRLSGRMRLEDVLDDSEIEIVARLAIEAADKERARQNRLGYEARSCLDRIIADLKAGRYDDCFAEDRK